MSLTLRFLLGLALVMALGYYLLHSYLSERVERQYMEAIEEPMVDAAEVLAGLWQELEAKSGEEKTGVLFARAWKERRQRALQARVYAYIKTTISLEVYVCDANGIVIFDSEDKLLGQDMSTFLDVARTLAGVYGARSTQEFGKKETLSSVMHVAAPILDQDGKINGVLTVRKPQASMQVFIDVTQRWLSALLATIFLAMYAVVALMIWWSMRPVRRVTDYAKAVREGKKVPAPHFRRSELKEMARALEDMRESLDGKAYVESYVQTLVHELKSPLAAIQGGAELLLEELPKKKEMLFKQNIRRECERLHGMVEGLQKLSQVERLQDLESRKEVCLGKLWQEVRAIWSDACVTKGLKVQEDLEDELLVHGDGELLKLVMSNILQNAIRFAEEGTQLSCVMQYEGDDGRAKKRVTFRLMNQGPQVPEFAIGRVFERFYSLSAPEQKEKGSGLGLCFAREVLQLHGGEIELRNVEGGVEVGFGVDKAC